MLGSLTRSEVAVQGWQVIEISGTVWHPQIIKIKSLTLVVQKHEKIC